MASLRGVHQPILLLHCWASSWNPYGLGLQAWCSGTSLFFSYIFRYTVLHSESKDLCGQEVNVVSRLLPPGYARQLVLYRI